MRCLSLTHSLNNIDVMNKIRVMLTEAREVAQMKSGKHDAKFPVIRLSLNIMSPEVNITDRAKSMSSFQIHNASH